MSYGTYTFRPPPRQPYTYSQVRHNFPAGDRIPTTIDAGTPSVPTGFNRSFQMRQAANYCYRTPSTAPFNQGWRRHGYQIPPPEATVPGGAPGGLIATSADTAVALTWLAPGGTNTWALVSSVTQGSPNTAGFTTSAIDTTGANLLVANIVDGTTGTPTLTDSKSNTWVLTTASPVISNDTTSCDRVYYCANPTVGIGHTFTTGGGGSVSMVVAAFSAASTAPFGSAVGSSVSGSTIKPGAVTLPETNALVATGMMLIDTGVTVSIDSSFTIVGQQPAVNGAHFGGGLAYRVVSAAVDPTWSGAPNFRAATIASFKAGGSGSTITDYTVQYRTTAGPGSWNTFSHTASTTPSITVTGLTNGTSYDFQVAAVTSGGTGSYSATASATPATVTNIGYRLFNGTTDSFEATLGNLASASSVPETWIFAGQIIALSIDAVVAHSPGFDPVDFYISNSGSRYQFFDGATNSTDGAAIMQLGVNVIAVFRRGTSTAARWSYAGHNGSAWGGFGHSNSSVTFSNRTYSSSGNITFMGPSGNRANARMALMARCNTAISDADVATLTTGLAAWQALPSLTNLWRFDQTPVVDLKGTSTQSSITGTTTGTGFPLSP